MLKKNRFILLFSLLISGSLLAQITINEEDNKKVQHIEVSGPQDSEETKREKPDSLEFISGDLFMGQLKKIDNKKLTWKHPESENNLVFKMDNLDVTKLGHVPITLRRDNVSNITLTNGDKLFGIIEELNEDQLILDTWYAGKIPIERPMIKAISSGGNVSQIVFEGPNNIEEWQQASHSSWKFKEGALASTRQTFGGSVGKDVDLPDKSSIDMQVQWKGSLNFQLHFYTDRIDSTGGNCYHLNFTRNYGYFNKNTANMGNTQLANFPLNFSSNKFQLTIKTDKANKNILIIVNGKVLRRIAEIDDFAGKGTGILFTSHRSDIKISKIRVTRWDGAIDDKSIKANSKSKDSILFANKDSVTGTLKSIKNGKVIFDTPFAPLTIPIPRIAQLTLNEEGYEMPRRRAGDAQIFFANEGGRITVDLKAITEGKVSGKSENFGSEYFKFDIRAFDKIIFNIYEDRKKEDEEDDW